MMKWAPLWPFDLKGSKKLSNGLSQDLGALLRRRVASGGREGLVAEIFQDQLAINFCEDNARDGTGRAINDNFI